MVEPDKVNIFFNEAFARLAPEFDPLETHFDKFMAAHKAAFAETVAYMKKGIIAEWGMVPDQSLPYPSPRTDMMYRKLYPHSTNHPREATGEGSEVWDYARELEWELAAMMMVISKISDRASFLEVDKQFLISAGEVYITSSAAGPALLDAIGKIITENL